MELIHYIRKSFGNLFQRRRLNEEMTEEMEHHLSMSIDRYEQEGMSPDEARRAAMRDFGGVGKLQEEVRDAWGTLVVMDLIRDSRYALRLLCKSKIFTLATVLILGLCIAGNAIVFSILHSILGPPSYPDPDQVVEIYNSYPGTGLDRMSSNIAQYLDYSENTSVFEQLSLVDETTVNLSSALGTVRGTGLRVTKEYFDMFRTRPLVGRFFVDEDFDHNDNSSLILTEAYWRNHFAGSSDVVGETLVFHGKPFTIIGVAPQAASAHFGALSFFQAWTWDVQRTEFYKERRHRNYTNLWGRLKAGVTVDQAKAQIDALDQRYVQQVSQEQRDSLNRQKHETKLETFQQTRQYRYGASLYLLQGSVLLVLLIGCINILNLQLTRGAGRSTEYAMRKSLGASRLALFRQVLIESGLLSLGSCLLGLLAGWWGLSLVNQFLLPDLWSGLSSIELSATSVWRVLFLSIGIALLLGVFSIVPVLKEGLSISIRESSRKTTASRSMVNFRSFLVSSQLALSLILLIGSGLLLQSFFNALNRDSGFDARDVKTASLELSWNYSSREKVSQFYSRLKTSLRSLPGIESAALATKLPSLEGEGYQNWSIFPGKSELDAMAGSNSSNIVFVSEGYFEALKIPLLEGRLFTAADTENPTRNVVVDRNFAEHFFPGQSPIGQQVYDERDRKSEYACTIIGVVENVSHNGLDRGDGLSATSGRYPLLYYPLNFNYTPREFSFLVRSKRSFSELLDLARENIKDLDPQLPLFLAGELDQMVDESLNDRRAFMLLISILGAMALLLSGIGVYGTLSYDVSQRVKEIGIRVAIGASRTLILKKILSQGFRKAMVGIAVGLMGAWILSDRLSDFLFQVSPLDPIAYIGVSLFLLAVAFIASYAPARKATLVDPIEALRSE